MIVVTTVKVDDVDLREHKGLDASKVTKKFPSFIERRADGGWKLVRFVGFDFRVFLCDGVLLLVSDDRVL